MTRTGKTLLGLLFLSALVVWGGMRAGFFFTSAVLDNGVMQFVAQSPYATMSAGGTITIPTGTDILLDWNAKNGLNYTNGGPSSCELYSSVAIDGVSTSPGGNGDSFDVSYQEVYGVRQVRSISSPVTFTLRCEKNGTTVSTQTITVTPQAITSTTVSQPFTHRSITYPSKVAPLNITVTSGSSTSGADGILDVTKGSDVTFSWTSSGIQNACSLVASDLPDPAGTFASGTVHPGNTTSTSNLNDGIILRANGSITISNIQKGITIALLCVTNIPPGGGSAQGVVGYASVMVQPQTNTALTCVNEVALPNATRNSLLYGPDNNLWFDDSYSQNPYRIGRMKADKTISYFNLNGSQNTAYDIAKGPDGNLWVARGNQVDKVTTAGATLAQYPVPNTTTWAQAVEIIAGPDGNMWFTGAGNIWKITMNGTLTKYTLPYTMTTVSGFYDPQGLAYNIMNGSDGNLWFTAAAKESGVWNGKVVKMTTAGVMTIYPVPKATGALVQDSGYVFFLQTDRKIGRMKMDGTGYVEIPITGLGANDELRDMTITTDGAIWVLVRKGGGASMEGISAVRLTGAMFSESTPNPTVNIYNLAKQGEPLIGDGYRISNGPRGNIWVSDSGRTQLVEIGCNTASAASSAPPASSSAASAALTYSLFTSPSFISWQSAEASCVSKGGHLATISSDQESTQAMQVVGNNTNVWIGLNDLQTEGSYKWSSGVPFSYSNWEAMQPNGTALDSGITANDCVFLNHNFSGSKWHDYGCADQTVPVTNYLCETGRVVPTIDLKINGQDGPITSTAGATVTLSWTSNGVMSCDTGTSDAPWGPNKPLATSGSQQVTVSASQSFGIQCTEIGGTNRTLQDSVAVTVPVNNCNDGIDNDGDGQIDGLKTAADQRTTYGSSAEIAAAINALGSTIVPVPVQNLEFGCYLNGNRSSTESDGNFCKGLGYEAAENAACINAPCAPSGTTTVYANAFWNGPQITRDDCNMWYGKAHTTWHDTLTSVTCVNKPDCSDGKDNDLDGKTDYPADTGCASASDTSEVSHDSNCDSGTNEGTSQSNECSDGIDNDGDGKIDRGQTAAVTPHLYSSPEQIRDAINGLGSARVPVAVNSKEFACGNPTQVYFGEASGDAGFCGLLGYGTQSYNCLYSSCNPQGGGTVNANAYVNGTGVLRENCQGWYNHASTTWHDYLNAAECVSGTACADGIDNDGDGKKDFPADTGCASVADTSEVAADPECADGNTERGATSQQSSGSCAQPEFVAANGSAEAQGWTELGSSTGVTLTGPFTENGTTYVRLTDTSTERGIRTEYQGITDAMLADKNWSMEMKARIVSSDPGAYTLGMNMMLTGAGGKNVSLYIEPTKFGVRGPLATGYEYGRTVNKTTTDAFHTYKIDYHKNASGVNDDTFDVLFDGQVVIAAVTRSEVHTWETGQGIKGISFGIGSSPGRGVMDVSYVKFNGEAYQCVSSSAPSGGVCTGTATIPPSTPPVRVSFEGTATGTVIANQFLADKGLKVSMPSGVQNKVIKINNKVFGFNTIGLVNIVDVTGASPEATFDFTTSDGKPGTTDLRSLRFLLYGTGSAVPQLQAIAYGPGGTVLETLSLPKGPQYAVFNSSGEVSRVTIRNLNGSRLSFADISYAPLICSGMVRQAVSSSSAPTTTSSSSSRLSSSSSSSSRSPSAASTSSSSRTSISPSSSSTSRSASSVLSLSSSSRAASSSAAALSSSAPASSSTMSGLPAAPPESSSSAGVLSNETDIGGYSCGGNVCASGGNTVCASYGYSCVDREQWPCYACEDENGMVDVSQMSAGPVFTVSVSSRPLSLALGSDASSSSHSSLQPSLSASGSVSSRGTPALTGDVQTLVPLEGSHTGAPVPQTGPASAAAMAAGAASGVAWVRKRSRRKNS